MSRARVRALLERARRAESLTPRRFMTLAVVSALATGVVIADDLDSHRPLTQIIAAAQGARTPVVRAVSLHPVRTPAAPKPRSVSTASAGHSSPGVSAASSGAAASTRSAVTRLQAQRPKAKRKAAAAEPASPIKHVFVISLAGADGDAIWGTTPPAPYLATTLRPKGTLLTDYETLANADDLASLIALTSGQPPTPDTAQNCPVYKRFGASGNPDASGGLVGSGCIYPDKMLTLPDQLTIAHLSWRGYFEDMSNDGQKSAACRRPSEDAADSTQEGRVGDEYAVDHNPFVYYGSLVDLGDCLSNDVPLEQLTTDLKSTRTTPSFAYVAPNLCHGGWEATCADGTPGGIAAADAFVKQWAQAILDSPGYRAGGLLIVLFGVAPVGAHPPGALLVSRYVTAGATDTRRYDPYALLRGIEDVFGLAHLAHAGDRGLAGLPVARSRAVRHGRFEPA